MHGRRLTDAHSKDENYTAAQKISATKVNFRDVQCVTLTAAISLIYQVSKLYEVVEYSFMFPSVQK